MVTADSSVGGGHFNGVQLCERGVLVADVALLQEAKAGAA